MGSAQDVVISKRLFITPELREDERELRDWFVREYMFDYNPLQAALRIGFMQPFANEYAKQFMNEAYVQKAIREATIVGSDNETARVDEIKRQIESSLIREANFHGADSSHGARVSALGKLSAIHGMDAAKQTEVNVNHRGGVMLIPAIANLEEWEAEAQGSQGELINASRIED